MGLLPRRARVPWTALAVAAAVAAAWGIAQALPPPAPVRDAYSRVAEGIAPDAPPAAVAAAALNAFGVALTARDVAAWRALVVRGAAPGGALRTVVDYRRALGDER